MIRVLKPLCPAILTACAIAVAVPARAMNWVELTPASGPMPAERTLSSAILDPVGHRMVIYGGDGASGRFADIWAFDLATETWTDLTPSSGPTPLKRLTPGSVYEPVNHCMLMWSGQGAGGTFFNDLWAFDLNTNTWTELTPAGGPPAIRYGVATIFDPVGGDLVTFAGFTFMGRFDDTWRYNAAAGTWTDVTAVTNPLERCLHSASYDSQDHRMIMYGGQNAGARNDIWAFDLNTNTWTDLTPVSKPPGRWFTVNIYHTPEHRVLIFGGQNSTDVLDDVWEFDLATNTWTQLSPGAGPSARHGMAGIYDAPNNRMVIFGGNAGGWVNEVWALENLTTPTSAGDTPARGVALRQNYPNPFNPNTTIGFDLDEAQHVTLRVFDTRGRRIRTLVDGARAAGPGSVTWDGRDDAGARVATGVYFYRLSAGDQLLSRSMVLLK